MKVNRIHLVVRPKDKGVKGFTDHHFSVGTTVREAIGEVEGAEIDNETENYIVSVKSEAQSKKLLKLRKLDDGFKIRVERHAQMNTCRVTIRSNLVTNMPDDSLLKELAKQGVIGVK